MTRLIIRSMNISLCYMYCQWWSRCNDDVYNDELDDDGSYNIFAIAEVTNDDCHNCGSLIVNTGIKTLGDILHLYGPCIKELWEKNN